METEVEIDKQFEYNTYIRDFFADNSSKTLEDAIRCWKYKKRLPGHNRYEKSDLAALGFKTSFSRNSTYFPIFTVTIPQNTANTIPTTTAELSRKLCQAVQGIL